MEIKKVGCSLCLMGAGIAQTAAMAGFETTSAKCRRNLFRKICVDRKIAGAFPQGTITANSKRRRVIVVWTTSFNDLADSTSSRTIIETWTRNKKPIAS